MTRDPLDRLAPRPWHHARVILAQLANTLASVASEIEGRQLLDFGAGMSPYRSLFSRFDHHVTADLPGLGAELDVVNGCLPVDDGTFDCVLSTQVLEHVPDPDSYLGEARRVLRPQGTLVLSTHGVYRYHPDPADHWRWTEPGLRLTLERNGFTVSSCIPVVSGLGASATMFSQYVGDGLPGGIRQLFHLVTQAVILVIERAVGGRALGDAAVYVIVAERSEDPNE